MNSLEARTLEMLIRVRQFDLAHLADFPASSRGRELFESVNGFIDSIERHSTARTQHARAAKEKTAQKNAAFDALRENMKSLARTARGMERITPGVRDKFRMPNGQRLQELLTTARAMAAEAEQHRDEFIRRGMPANFIQEFVSRIEDVEQGVDSMAQKSAASVSSRAAVKEATQGAREAVRELDAIVRNVYGAGTSTLVEWESASHVERAGRGVKTVALASPPAPATA